LPGVGLAGPMFAFAVIAGAMLLALWRFLPEETRLPLTAPKSQDGVTAEPSRFEPKLSDGKPGKAPSLWRDPRLTPFLLFGFLVASAQTVNGQTLGFLIIDKLKLAPMKPWACIG
ncbi:hypothetical protein ACNJUT_22045, partial [Mycobacterium tuberculosis]